MLWLFRFLATPLMKEVSKAPMIKPPVVKTNVLRMNQNFRASLKLYDFVTSYNQDGYTFKEIKKILKPLPNETADELAETIELTAALTYITGNDIKSLLEERLSIKEKEAVDIVNKKSIEELKRLKKRIVEMNEDPFEYIIKLEKRNIQLEKESGKLASEIELNQILSKQIEELSLSNQTLQESIKQMNIKISNNLNEIDVLNQKYFDDLTEAETIHQSELSHLSQEHTIQVQSINQQHQSQLASLVEMHRTEVERLAAAHRQTLNTLTNQYKAEKNTLIEQHQFEVQTLTNKYKEMSNSFEQRIDDLNQKITQLNDEITQLNHKNSDDGKRYQYKIDLLENQVNRLDDENKYANARYLALKKQQGLISEKDDFTSKERFKQLELEMAAYKKLFKENWKKTKLKNQRKR